jgi:FkbM family methyltransferase
MSGKNLCKNITNRLIKQYNLDAYSYLELEKTIPGSVLPFLYLENAGNCYQKSFKYFNLVKKLLDNQSQAELERNFQIRLNYNLNSSIEPEKQFFSCLRSFPKIKSGELCFVDVGAYDGDTINDFLGVFSNQYQRIIAFEPDSANFDKLKNYAQKNLAKNSFELHQKASWHQECELSFQADANMGSFMSSTGNTKVKTITLDSILAKSDFKDIFIKLDVEGAEPETIKGMSQTIKAHEPILAISVYHHPDHLWQCFEMIEQLSQNYSYLLRSYGGDGLDLLLYAIPDRFL